MVGPKMGVSKCPQVSAPQCINPETKSTKNCAAINPRRVGKGPE